MHPLDIQSPDDLIQYLNQDSFEPVVYVDDIELSVTCRIVGIETKLDGDVQSLKVEAITINGIPANAFQSAYVARVNALASRDEEVVIPFVNNILRDIQTQLEEAERCIWDDDFLYEMEKERRMAI